MFIGCTVNCTFVPRDCSAMFVIAVLSRVIVAWGSWISTARFASAKREIALVGSIAVFTAGWFDRLKFTTSFALLISCVSDACGMDIVARSFCWRISSSTPFVVIVVGGMGSRRIVDWAGVGV